MTAHFPDLAHAPQLKVVELSQFDGPKHSLLAK
jgi:hypothetical protein